MKSTEIKKLDKAFEYFQKGNRFAAKNLIIDALESDPNKFMSWFITEKNPEYTMTSKEFLSFIQDVVSNQYGA